MIKRGLALLAAWTGLGAMQAPPAASPSEIALWRLDCGEIEIAQYGAFFSDTFQYPPGPKKVVGSCYLIRHGDQYLLWDTGLPGELAGRSIDLPGQTMRLSARIVDQLARIRVRPEQINIVGISHYHLDHLGQAADFPRAKLVMGAGDVALLKAGPASDFRQPARIQNWLDGKAELVEARGDVDLFGDGRVVMLSMPGHTPSHYSLLIRLQSGPVLLSGDLYHFSEQVENRGVPPFNHDRADTLASMDRFDRIARNLGAKAIIQHEPDHVGRLPAFPEAAR